MLAVTHTGIPWKRLLPDGRLAREMRAEGIVEPFTETIETGWWTTCLEILPAKERSRGKY